jgi:hypothetical protein
MPPNSDDGAGDARDGDGDAFFREAARKHAEHALPILSGTGTGKRSPRLARLLTEYLRAGDAAFFLDIKPTFTEPEQDR